VTTWLNPNFFLLTLFAGVGLDPVSGKGQLEQNAEQEEAVDFRLIF